MVSVPSKATIAASSSGKARMGISLVPRPRARIKGAGVGVASAEAGIESGVEPGVAVDEGALECVATTEVCTVGVTVVLFVIVVVAVGAACRVALGVPAAVGRGVEPPGLGVGVDKMDRDVLMVAVGDGVGHSTWGMPTSIWALVVEKVRVNTWP